MRCKKNVFRFQLLLCGGRRLVRCHPGGGAASPALTAILPPRGPVKRPVSTLYRSLFSFILCNFRKCTAKNRCRKFETNIPRKGIARPQSQLPHSCVCERFILYIPTIDLPILLQEICGPIMGIYKSLTDTCMWGLRGAIPRKGIQKWYFRCSVVKNNFFVSAFMCVIAHVLYICMKGCMGPLSYACMYNGSQGHSRLIALISQSSRMGII